jgi:ElaB/YqjD/DUF883 family membrane-anchored ribosome-binding protein
MVVALCNRQVTKTIQKHYEKGENMANEQNNQTKDTSFDEAKNQPVKETAKGFFDQAKNTVGQAYGTATKRATEVLEEQKETLAGGLTSVADSIKQVGENLNNPDEQNKITETAAKYTNSLAQQIEQISDYFEHKEIREMVRDVEGFARKYPAYFIGGAFALGFLAARFLKSTSPKQLTQKAGQTFNADRDFENGLSKGAAKPAANPS